MKVWNYCQDYPASEYIVFQRLFFVETMGCGSEWVCSSGAGGYLYHRLNGSAGEGALTAWDGAPVWEGALRIEPEENPPDYWGFGRETTNLSTGSTNLPWPGGNASDFIFHIDQFGLYRFDAAFTDAMTGTGAAGSFHRAMGDEVAGYFHGVWGAILGGDEGMLWLDHEEYPPEQPLAVHRAAFQGRRAWAGLYDSASRYRYSAPGRVRARFLNARTGVISEAWRNIDGGSWGGNQTFLFDFRESVPPGAADVRVSLQPPDAPLPVGFRRDCGQAYGLRLQDQQGTWYGWR